MKKATLLIIVSFTLFVSMTFAQTIVQAGIISGTWSLAGSPYKIFGAVQIPNDSTLTIEPGVIVDFQGPYKFSIKGRLIAIGTASDSIYFTTSLPPDLTPPSPTPHTDSSHWVGVVFDNILTSNDTSRMQYCIVQSVRSSVNLIGTGGVTFSNVSKAIISNCTITNCSGGYYSGGIYCDYSSPMVSYNLIINNLATGIYCHAGNPVIIYNIIANNSNPVTGLFTGGGGILCTYSNAYISNNIIVNNSAYNGGGIACNDYSVPAIANNVISNNSATYGGGIYFHNTNTNLNPNLYNNIIWGNTSSNSGSQVLLWDEENDPNFFNCDIQGGTSAFGVNGTIYTGTYQSNINIDPLFVSPSNASGVNYDGTLANWSLQSNSPCIDTGYQNGNYLSKDMAGNPRINVCRIDIGAYEYQLGIPLELSLNISQPILCNGTSTGIVTSNASGGTMPYTYLWSTGQTGATATGLRVGNYSLTVYTPSYGCSISKSITLKEPTAIAVDAGSDKTAICDASIQLDAQPKWVKLNIDTGSNTSFNSVCFTSEETGFVVGSNGTLLKTTNGGADWTAIQNVTYNNSHSVYFVNSKVGYVVGDYGVIIKTIDGGSSWITLQQSGSSYNLNAVYFPDSNTGYAVGTNGKILKTIDGGKNWISQSSGTTFYLNSVYFTDVNTGCAVGNSGIILKTNNGGATWASQTITTMAFINSVCFVNANTGYAVGSGNNTNGTVLKTTDGGTTWVAQSTQQMTSYSVLRSIYFVDENTGYIVGGNANGTSTILKTTNSGISWSLLSSTTTNDLYSVYFSNPNIGYAVGANGTILKLSVNGTYKWSPSSGLNIDNIQSPVANVITDSKYFVTFTTPNGCIASDSIEIHTSRLTIDAGQDKTLICGGAAQLDSVSSNYVGKLTYHWTPSLGLNSDTIPNPIAKISGQNMYTVVANTMNGCSATDSVRVTTIPMNATDLCIVGVDSTNKNILVWNKPVSNSISSFYIYRETNVTNIYQQIGIENYNSLSSFVDTNSFPDVQSNKYKISIKDNCGLESRQSAYHKTMHISINQGIGNSWNIILEPYEGFTVSTYNVYRGISHNNLQKIGTSSGSNTQYTDLNAPSGYLYYQIEVISPDNCYLSKTYNSSRSNIASNSSSGIDNFVNVSDFILIYPNPSNTDLQIQTDLQIHSISITDFTGKVIYTTTSKKIDCSGFAKGVYLIKVITNDGIGIKKLLVK